MTNVEHHYFSVEMPVSSVLASDDDVVNLIRVKAEECALEEAHKRWPNRDVSVRLIMSHIFTGDSISPYLAEFDPPSTYHAFYVVMVI